MVIISGSFSVRAALDTQPRLPYNPNAPRKVKKTPNSNSFLPPPLPPPPPSPRISISVDDLLKRPESKELSEEEVDDSYMGYETWSPSPPKLEKPRSVFNAASLAFIGDSIYELYARRHFLFPPLSIEDYNDRVRAVVRCEAQYALLKKLVDDDFLTKEERDVLRWGKNLGSARTRSRRRAGVAVYNKASSLETLIGYLYLTNGKRLEKIMEKLGFSSDSSTEIMIEMAKPKPKPSESNLPSFILNEQVAQQ
ncbi:Ribonuclease III family protein [Hirschfeldia incana]|nr:Ribonuclease III family protein [Hirschfeldia incana]